MANFEISYTERTITLTKKDMTAAQKYGSDAYNALQQARRDNPGFRIVTASRRTSTKESFKGLTFKYMEAYIAKHDDEASTIMTEYKTLRGEGGEEINASLSYGEIRKWFLDTFPAIKDFNEKRDAILKNTGKRTLAAENQQ